MEYIHKAKAEKTRTKVLTDQMEARRVKNKVRISCLPIVCTCSPATSGCPRASRTACGGEEAGNPCYRARGRRSGVNMTILHSYHRYVRHVVVCILCHAALYSYVRPMLACDIRGT